MDVRLENPGGLTGVWAEENTRASLFDAMYRKETFGVSGPHIKVRFFGGWGYDKNLAEREGLGEAILCGRRSDGRGSGCPCLPEEKARRRHLWSGR